MANEIARGFSLTMRLRDPSRLLELMEILAIKRETIDEALNALDYVHSARFLPLFEQGLLLIVTEFDGVAKDYVMDFAAVLDDEFSLILSYMDDAPPLPVSRYPDEFWAYVDRNTRPPQGEYPSIFMPYHNKTVLDIMGAKRAKQLLPRPGVGPAEIPLTDLQANIVRGYGAAEAAHFGVRFASAENGRSFVEALLKGSLQVTPAEPWPRKPAYCLNIGFTYEGLAALGVPYNLLRQLPEAFAAGPLKRAEKIGEVGNNDPKNWQTGAVDAGGKPHVVHALLSLYAASASELPEKELQELMAKHQVSSAFEALRARVLNPPDYVHFGYRDNISQPSIAGVRDADDQASPLLPPGDFVLGVEYANSRGGHYIGTLPAALAQNATYGALRIIEQHTDAFEGLLSQVAKEHGLDRELVAAKLMGRWRDGTPLALSPKAPERGAATRSAGKFDQFDYVKQETGPDSDEKNDFEGARCPMGAHIRRLNPRSGLVLGMPWGRRLIRRGMPYGDSAVANDGKKRGLVGMFYCADLETQYEFLLRVWANQDVSAFGIQGTKEPFIGAREGTTPFTFAPPGATTPIKIEIPPLTTCRGSLYLFLPGMSGLRWLAKKGWETRRAPPDRPPVDITYFDPADTSFHTDPYAFYAAFRAREAKGSLTRIGGGYDSYWIFSHDLVKEVCDNDTIFEKPGKDRDKAKGAFGEASVLGDGLFYMDCPRHKEVRSIMDAAFAPSWDPVVVTGEARAIADGLLGAMAGKSACEFVGEFAAQLPMRVFMQMMGIPVEDAVVVDQWVRTALRGHDAKGTPADRLAGGTASMALRSYFLALGEKCRRPGRSSEGPSLMHAMQERTTVGGTAKSMTTLEAMNTAVQFALGGYLSTQFLIASGVYTLLRHPEQWDRLVTMRELLNSAVEEMVRYEAPFQIADRWVGSDYTLRGFPLKAGTKLAVVYGSANRDPGLAADADEFRIGRPPLVGAYGFGHGIHYCIGEPLARIVTRVALDALLDHYPCARLGTVGPWSNDPYYRSLSQMTLLLR